MFLQPIGSYGRLYVIGSVGYLKSFGERVASGVDSEVGEIPSCGAQDVQVDDHGDHLEQRTHKDLHGHRPSLRYRYPVADADRLPSAYKIWKNAFSMQYRKACCKRAAISNKWSERCIEKLRRTSIWAFFKLSLWLLRQIDCIVGHACDDGCPNADEHQLHVGTYSVRGNEHPSCHEPLDSQSHHEAENFDILKSVDQLCSTCLL